MTRWLQGQVGAIGAALVWGGLAAVGVTGGAEWALYDARLRWLPRPAPDPAVVLVAIDEASLNGIGAWPWPRDVQAQLLDGLGPARGVLWDVILGEHGADRQQDEALADALARQGRVLLAAGSNNTYDAGRAFTLPAPPFRAAAHGIGMVTFQPDPDGVTRGGSAALTAPDTGVTVPTLHWAFAGLMNPDRPAPPAGKVYFNFQGNEHAYPAISALDVLDGLVPPEAFQDKFVLVGATAEGLNDRVTLPDGVLSGVLYNGQAAVSWARGDWRVPLPGWVMVLLAALAAWGTVMLWETATAGGALAISAGLALLWLLADGLLFMVGRTWLPSATVGFSATATLLVVGTVRQLSLAVQLRHAIHRLLSAFQERQLSLATTAGGDLTPRRPLQAQIAALLVLTDAICDEWQFLQALIVTNQNPVLVCDRDAGVMLSNPAAHEVFGPEVATGNLLAILAQGLDEEHLAACGAALTTALVSGEGSLADPVSWRGRSCQVRFLKMSAVHGALCLIEDVTALHRRANTDGLTGLWNRRYFDEQADRELARCARYGADRPLALVLIDIDHFKRVNDTYGHQIGDRVLVQVAAVLQRMSRQTDLAVRYGGEEMALLLPQTDHAGAKVLAERVRQEIESLMPADDDGQPFRVTASFGIAGAQPDETLASLLARADKALYRSKENGRNQVTLADDGDGDRQALALS